MKTNICKARVKSFSKSFLLITCFLILGIPFLAAGQNLEDAPLPMNVVNQVATAWGKESLGRYMGDTEGESNSCQKVTNWPNWERFQLKRCTYTADGKIVAIVMLNPSREILIKWVVASCVLRNPTSPEGKLSSCANNLMEWIRGQSGSQFPVAGIVWEPGAYSFRDGLTVELKLKPHRSWTKPINKDFQDASLNPNYPILRYGAKARIASTTREQYKNYETRYLHRAPTDTSKEKYLAVIRGAYQDAWKRAHDTTVPETIGKYRNDLIVAQLFWE